MRSLLAIILIFALATAAFPQAYTETLVAGATLLPGTTYYYPDGTASDDSAWLILKTSNFWYQPTLFLRQDTVLVNGVYLRPTDFPCSVRVSLIAGVSTDTFSYIGYQAQKVYYPSLDSAATRIASTTDSINSAWTSLKSSIVAQNDYVIFNDALSMALPIDTCLFVPVPDVARMDKHRWKVTVTDTMKLWATETARRGN